MGDWRIPEGDCGQLPAALPGKCVHCVITFFTVVWLEVAL
jgi:hypothetical protein